MTEKDKIRALAASRDAQMHDALQAARTLIQAGLPRDAVNRVYYAIYYRMVALLLLRRMEPSTHSGTLTLFSREFVRMASCPESWHGLRTTPSSGGWRRTIPAGRWHRTRRRPYSPRRIGSWTRPSR